MRAEVRKSIEFSLPQAQVFYISSRNKFILVKTTNLSLSPFMPSCTPISSATIIPISSFTLGIFTTKMLHKQCKSQICLV